MSSNSSYYNNTRFDVIDMVRDFDYKNVLEVGGGGFSTLLKLTEMHDAFGWGIDPFVTDRPTCDNIKIIQGHFGDPKFDHEIPDELFDLLIAADVLEHIHDTDVFFATAGRKLRSNGHLLLSVPNIRQIRSFIHIFIRGAFPRDDSGLFDKTHLRWFCRQDVIGFAEAHGFKLLRHRYVGRFVPELMKSVRLFEFLALQNLFLFEKN